ncbi:hypothetical protein BHE74_00016578 [Ensete ventricosum]|nr:hypothetical protein BHE74_00016578 [Ensete ventricosum]
MYCHLIDTAPNVMPALSLPRVAYGVPPHHLDYCVMRVTTRTEEATDDRRLALSHRKSGLPKMMDFSLPVEKLEWSVGTPFVGMLRESHGYNCQASSSEVLKPHCMPPRSSQVGNDVYILSLDFTWSQITLTTFKTEYKVHMFRRDRGVRPEAIALVKRYG